MIHMPVAYRNFFLSQTFWLFSLVLALLVACKGMPLNTMVTVKMTISLIIIVNTRNVDQYRRALILDASACALLPAPI